MATTEPRRPKARSSQICGTGYPSKGKSAGRGRRKSDDEKENATMARDDKDEEKPRPERRRRSKIKACKEQPIRIGDKIVRPSKRCTLTVTDAVDIDDGAEQS